MVEDVLARFEGLRLLGMVRSASLTCLSGERARFLPPLDLFDLVEAFSSEASGRFGEGSRELGVQLDSLVSSTLKIKNREKQMTGRVNIKARGFTGN